MAAHGFRKVKLVCCGLEVTAASMHALAHRAGCGADAGREAQERAFARAAAPALAVAMVHRATETVTQSMQSIGDAIAKTTDAVIDFAAAYKASLANVDNGPAS